MFHGKVSHLGHIITSEDEKPIPNILLCLKFGVVLKISINCEDFADYAFTTEEVIFNIA